MSPAAQKAAVPVWVIVIAVVVVVGVATALAVRSLSGPRAAVAPIDVRPGMYDFREELRKGNVGRRSP